MRRSILSCVLALGLVGCRTSEPVTGARASSADPEEGAAGQTGEGQATATASGAEQNGEGEGQAAVAGGAEQAGEGEGEAAATVEEGEAAGEVVVSKPADPSGGTPGAPAGVDASGAAAAQAGSIAASGAKKKRARIKAFFASDPEEALENRRYTARKPPEPAGQILGLLDVRPLLDQPVLASPKDDAEVIATLTPKGLTTPTDACMWVVFQQEIPWTKGKLRCGDVFLRERTGAEGTEEMLPMLELFKDDAGALWGRVIATNDGRTGWVRIVEWFRPFVDVLSEYSAGGSPTWDRVIYSEPGGTPVKIKFRGAIALQVHEALVDAEGRTWLRVEARVDQCIEGSRRKLGAGWIPQHDEHGALNVYYELSC